MIADVSARANERVPPMAALGVAVAAALLGEVPAPLTLVGGAIVLAGIYVTGTARRGDAAAPSASDATGE